jgi:hypothetical protein
MRCSVTVAHNAFRMGICRIVLASHDRSARESPNDDDTFPEKPLIRDIGHRQTAAKFIQLSFESFAWRRIMEVEKELARLKRILPLEQNQKHLGTELLAVHRGILYSFAEHGRPLENAIIGQMLGGRTVSEVLTELAAKDLVVLDEKKERVVGAYPFTTEKTAHTVIISGVKTYAMCAVDALSISPMFNSEVTIESRCHVSGVSIRVRQREMEILEAQPSLGVRVGVRWQGTGGCAAHSLCMEMVFLSDRETAVRWQNEDNENRSIFTLPEAIEFGTGFFLPLVGKEAVAEKHCC